MKKVYIYIDCYPDDGVGSPTGLTKIVDYGDESVVVQFHKADDTIFIRGFSWQSSDNSVYSGNDNEEEEEEGKF